MSLQLRLFGGSQTAAGKLPATNDGNQALLSPGSGYVDSFG
jgi:hypothetical protein